MGAWTINLISKLLQSVTNYKPVRAYNWRSGNCTKLVNTVNIQQRFLDQKHRTFHDTVELFFQEPNTQKTSNGVHYKLWVVFANGKTQKSIKRVQIWEKLGGWSELLAKCRRKRSHVWATRANICPYVGDVYPFSWTKKNYLQQFTTNFPNKPPINGTQRGRWKIEILQTMKQVNPLVSREATNFELYNFCSGGRPFAHFSNF